MELMTGPQGRKLEWMLETATRGSTIPKEEWETLVRIQISGKLTKAEASDLIDWLVMMDTSEYKSPAYVKGEQSISDFIHSKQTN